jgi:hypothetical protein
MEDWPYSEASFYMSEFVHYSSKGDTGLIGIDSTQKILQHARMAEAGLVPRDPMREAIGLELDMLNILYGFQFTPIYYIFLTLFLQYSYCADPCDAKWKEEINMLE